MSMGLLIDIDELVRIQEHAAKGEEVDGLRGGEFFGSGISLEAELEGPLRSLGTLGEVAG